MNKKPIIFSTPMVKAILEGRKTMTRRIPRNYDKILTWYEDAQNIGIPAGGQIQSIEDIFRNKRPYSEGDILWVRETWLKDEYRYHFKVLDNGQLFYEDDSTKWKPSIHMPRKAARLFLEVNAIRVERLQDISEEDARAEGIKSYWRTKEAGEGAEDWHESSGPPYIGAAEKPEDELCQTRRQAFQQLWDSLNAKRGYSWESNPWVWVIEFKRIEK